MNLIDQLTQMQANGKSVVSITFILNSLGSIESHECENCTRIPVYEMSAIRSGLMSVKDEQMESIVTLSDGKNYKTW